MKMKILLTAAAVSLVALLIWVLWANKALEVNTYAISSERLPAGFDGYRIAQISDLHNDTFGKNNEKLLTMLAQTAPDMIAITGDMIDSRDTNVEIALAFAEEAGKIAPCYYVSGNHESRIPEDYARLKQGLRELGVVVLEDEKIELIRSGETITLMGVDDPRFLTEVLYWEASEVMHDKLQLLAKEHAFTVLLSHRPELFDVYGSYGIDIVLTGHAHGGQIRLPFVGGILAPQQGIFPEYDAGLYTEGNTQMIVSRGLGNSIFPVRINNRPEIVVIELQK